MKKLSWLPLIHTTLCGQHTAEEEGAEESRKAPFYQVLIMLVGSAFLVSYYCRIGFFLNHIMKS